MEGKILLGSRTLPQATKISMKVSKVISVKGEYAKVGVDVKDGDSIRILDAGQTTEGEYGERKTFRIETSNGEKNMSFNQTSLNNLIDAYGDETEEWIGKNAQVFVVKQMVSGTLRNVAYLAAQGWEMGDDGRFFKVVNE